MESNQDAKLKAAVALAGNLPKPFAELVGCRPAIARLAAACGAAEEVPAERTATSPDCVSPHAKEPPPRSPVAGAAPCQRTHRKLFEHGGLKVQPRAVASALRGLMREEQEGARRSARDMSSGRAQMPTKLQHALAKEAVDAATRDSAMDVDFVAKLIGNLRPLEFQAPPKEDRIELLDLELQLCKETRPADLRHKIGDVDEASYQRSIPSRTTDTPGSPAPTSMLSPSPETVPSRCQSPSDPWLPAQRQQRPMEACEAALGGSVEVPWLSKRARARSASQRHKRQPMVPSSDVPVRLLAALYSEGMCRPSPTLFPPASARGSNRLQVASFAWGS
eukprot:TRINITY_DN76810_c0_g1_i1.p1 TRINITY_DN76810_c0_g1~~TRINITY_DN76810_c0_g1_i1.p1  ORF type:complete len:350 (-),score=72.04 TRINITY_DN76810_c0_g1_i1:44-1048(-)